MSASRLPEYFTLVVNNVNGEVSGNITSIFCHSVTCPGADQCYWDRNQMLRWFLNIPQCLLVNMQCVIQFRTSFSHIHLQPAGGCALQVASKKLFDTRKEELLTSHLNKLGDSLTCLLQDCLSIPHLSWVRSMERWLAMLQASSSTESHVLNKTNAAGMGIICQGDSWMFAGTCL